MTVREALELYSAFYAKPADNGKNPQNWRALAERLGITDKLSTRFADLSGGQKQRLFISQATVKTHLTHIYAELGVKDRAAAVAVAYDRGILG